MRALDDDEPGSPDDGDKPETKKGPILGQVAGGIELFLLVLMVIEKLGGMTDHWLS